MGARELLVLFDRATEPAKNLAREEDIFDQVERRGLPEVLRFWRNTECLVRGRARSPRYGWYNEELAAKMNIRVFERSTGGGVVYQDLGNLNWSFFLRASGVILSPKALFERGSAYVVRALRRVGFDANFAPPNRIEVSGRKVSGMAAKSTRNTSLVHGTLLIETDLETLNSLCVAPPGSPPVANLREWSAEAEADGLAEIIREVLTLSDYKVRSVDELGAEKALGPSEVGQNSGPLGHSSD